MKHLILKKSWFKTSFLLSNLILLTSCSLLSLPNSVKDSIDKSDANIDKLNNKANNIKNIKNENFNYEVNSIYISNVIVKKQDTDFLPNKFNNQIQIDGAFMSLNQLADALNKLTKYPVLLDINDDSNNQNKFYLRLTQNSGTLIDLLNNIAAKADIAWNFRDGKIVLSSFETKTWSIKGISGNTLVQNQVNSNSGFSSSTGSSGSSGGATSDANNSQNTVQSVQFNMNNSIWDSLQNAVKSLLSKTGALSINQATSSVTVIDKPSVLLKVDRFIKQQNEILKRQVQIDVQVLNVQTDANDDYGINWGLVFKNAGANFNINGENIDGDSGVAKITKIFSPSSTTQSFTFGSPEKSGSAFAGSSLIIQALSKINKTSMVTSVAATTLNNQPVPVQLVEQQSYIANTSVTQAMGAGVQTSLQTGQITSGFVLNILPVIESNGLVNLQISLNLSNLKDMKKFSVNSSTVQLPDLIQRNTMQKTTMRTGDTYVITGFDNLTEGLEHTGVGSAYNWLLGGGVSANKSRTKLVILVTPRIINI